MLAKSAISLFLWLDALNALTIDCCRSACAHASCGFNLSCSDSGHLHSSLGTSSKPCVRWELVCVRWVSCSSIDGLLPIAYLLCLVTLELTSNSFRPSGKTWPRRLGCLGGGPIGCNQPLLLPPLAAFPLLPPIDASPSQHQLITIEIPRRLEGGARATFPLNSPATSLHVPTPTRFPPRP